MAIHATCPTCKKTINASDHWAGKRAKCPGCGADIDFPAAELQLSDPAPIVEARTRVEPVPVPPLERGHVAHAPSVNVHLPRRTSSLGVVSLVLGIVGFIFCWIPLLGILTIPLSALGLLLGGIGLLVAIVRRGSGIGYPIAGIAICGLALFIAGSQVAVIGAAATAVQEAAQQQARTNQVSVTPFSPDDDDYSDEDYSRDVASGQDQQTKQESIDAGSGPSTNTAAEPPSNPAPQNDWASAEQPVRQGNVQVRIMRTALEVTPLRAAFSGETTSESEQFSIQVEVTNLSSSQKINYRTWQGAGFSIGRDHATVKDNFGNSYKRIDFGITNKVVGRVESDSIYPGKSITDLLVFEPPLENVEYLDLELPASNVGGDGMLRLRIPRTMFLGPDPEQLARERAEREAAEQAKREAEQARLAAEEEAKFRTWTSASGGRTVEAKLVSYLSSQVLLENRDGKRTKVPLDKLSEEDQKFVEEWRKSRR